MTAQNKTTIKAYFETGDRPTQGQFIDFIDSYQDINSNLTTLASANVGAVGLQLLSCVTSASAQTAIGGGVVGRQVFQAITTVAAQQAIGGGTVGIQIYQAVTTAAAAAIIGVASASTAAFGTTRLASDAEFQAGTAADRSVTPSNVLTGLGFADFYDSPQQTITAGGGLTLAHGLTREPVNIQTFIVCTSAEFGYTAGNKLLVPPGDDSGSASGLGVAIVPDATNLNCRYGNNAAVFIGKNFGTGAVVSFTNTNWRLIVRAWG